MSLRKRKKQCVVNTDSSRAHMEVDFQEPGPGGAARNANDLGPPLAPLVQTSVRWIEPPRQIPHVSEFMKGNPKQEGILPENRPMCSNPNASLPPSTNPRYLANHRGGTPASDPPGQPTMALRHAAPNHPPNGFGSQLFVPPESHIPNSSPITHTMGSSRVALLKHSPQQGQPLILQRQTRLLQPPLSGVQTHSMNPDATALSKGFHQPLGGHPQNSGQPMAQQRKVYIDCTHSVAPGQGTMEITDRNMPAHPSRFQDGGGLIRPAHGHQISPQLLAVPNSCPSTRPLVQEIVATNGDLNTPILTQPGLQNGCDMMENRAIMANTSGPGVVHGNGRVYVDELEMHKEQAIRRSSRMLNRNDLPPQYPMPTGPPVMNYPFMQAKSDWTEHVAPDGRRYWWNKSMEESTWRKPEGIRVAEEFLASAKGWKIKTSATGRRIYEHMVTHNCSLDLPAAVQNEFEDPKKTTAAPKEKHTRQLQMSERNNSEKQMVNGASTASPAILKLEARNRQLGEMLVDREVQLENLRRQIAIFDKLGKTQGPDGIAKLVHMEGMRSELEATPLLWAFDKIVQEVGNPQQRKEIDSRAASDEQEGGGVDRGALEDDTKAKSGVSTEKEEKEAARGGSVKTSTQTMDEQQITPSEGKPVQDMDVDGNQNE